MELAPGTTTGMTVGAQIAQTEPPPVITTGMRTKVQRGVDLTGAPVRRGHGVWWYRRRRLGRRGISLTQGTMRLVRQALEGLRRGGSFALGLDGRRCRWYRSPAVRRGNMQHDEEPHESQQSELVVKKVGNHDLAPSPVW